MLLSLILKIKGELLFLLHLTNKKSITCNNFLSMFGDPPNQQPFFENIQHYQILHLK